MRLIVMHPNDRSVAGSTEIVDNIRVEMDGRVSCIRFYVVRENGTREYDWVLPLWLLLRIVENDNESSHPRQSLVNMGGYRTSLQPKRTEPWLVTGIEDAL